MNLAVFVTPPRRLFSREMCLNIGPAPLVRAFLQPWLWIMTFSCWKWKLCGEMVLSAPLAGLELRQPARLARCGIPLPASLLSVRAPKQRPSTDICGVHFLAIWTRGNSAQSCFNKQIKDTVAALLPRDSSSSRGALRLFLQVEFTE